MNFLTALSLINNGIREILPFIRYIAQFVDSKFSQIHKQDQGKGVVCAATWIMPAALVPRPWNFPDPPVLANPLGDGTELAGSPDSYPELKPHPVSTQKPAPGAPLITPVPMTSALNAVTVPGVTET